MTYKEKEERVFRAIRQVQVDGYKTMIYCPIEPLPEDLKTVLRTMRFSVQETGTGNALTISWS